MIAGVCPISDGLRLLEQRDDGRRIHDGRFHLEAKFAWKRIQVVCPNAGISQCEATL